MTIAITNPTLSPTVDLGNVMFAYQLPFTGTDGVNTQMQMYLDNGSSDWPKIVPPAIGLVPNDVNAGTFTSPVPIGKYTQARVLFFRDGTNYSDFLGEMYLPCVFEVTTTQIRLTTPQMIAHTEKMTSDGKGNSFYPYELRLPAHWQPADLLAFSGDAYVWTMVKGSAGFAQTQLWFTDKVHWNPFVQTATGPDPYLYVDTLYDGTTPLGFTLPTPAANGVFNLNFGFFKSTWGSPLWWSWPPFEFEVGGDAWETKCPAASLPPLPPTLAKDKAPFAITGNYGNAICFKPEPANNNVTFFKLLVAKGIQDLRFNFDPNQYLVSPVYQHRVDQIVQNMWMAGANPCIAPQWVPAGGVPELLAVNQMVAAKYKGMPIKLDLCNEPSQYGTWAAWKPIAQQVAVAMQAIDPTAYLVCPLEGFSKDANAASADPLPEGLVQCYGWHPYLDASQLQAAAGPGTIKLWAQESNDGSLAYNQAMQALPHVIGYGAWAWTTPGDDSIALIASVNGAVLTLDSVGQALVGYYATWKAGNRLSAPTPVASVPVVTPVPPVAPVVPPSSGSNSPGLSMADIDAEVQKLLGAAGYEAAANIPTALATAVADNWTSHQADLKALMDAEVVSQSATLLASIQSMETTLTSLQAAAATIPALQSVQNTEQSALTSLQADEAAVKAQQASDEATAQALKTQIGGDEMSLASVKSSLALLATAFAKTAAKPGLSSADIQTAITAALGPVTTQVGTLVQQVTALDAKVEPIVSLFSSN